MSKPSLRSHDFYALACAASGREQRFIVPSPGWLSRAAGLKCSVVRALIGMSASLLVLTEVGSAGAVDSADAVPLERLTWRHRNPQPIGQGFAGVVAGPECFIAYGEGGLILRSTNGVFWDVVPVPLKASFIDGRHVEGEFLLVGESYVLTSPDGLSWTIRQLPVGPDGFRPTAFNASRCGERWAVLATDGLYVSLDGENWERWPFPGLGLYSRMALGPDRIVLFKSLFSELTLVTAMGPSSWTETPAPFLSLYSDMGYANGSYVVVGENAVAASTDAESWDVVPVDIPTLVSRLAWSGARWVLSAGASGFFESRDARTWERFDVDAFEHLGYVAVREPGIWFATGDRGGLATSTDRVNWIRRDRGMGPTMHAIARIVDRWVAVGQEGTAMSSVDGFQWDQKLLIEDYSIFTDLISDEHVLYARSDHAAFTTIDGVNWTPAASLPPMQWDFSGLPPFYVPRFTPTWVGDRWLLQANIPGVGAGALFSSFDGRDWTMVLQSGLFITSVAGRPGAYVAAGGHGTGLMFSTDTITWENVPIEHTFHQAVTTVLEGHGWFLAGTPKGIIASQDGRDWRWLPGITSQIYGGARIGESFWFTGQYGTIIEVMPHLEAPIANLSSRAHQSAGSLPVIAGFVVEGDEPVDVLVRAVGEGLRSYGVENVVERPTLHLYHGQSISMSAGDWAQSSERAEIEDATRRSGAFALPEGGGDAAFVARLGAGAYTTIVEGGSARAGEVLVEVYDSGSTDGASLGGRLANNSVRGEATADHALIGGVVVRGDYPRRVLLRAIGPGLSAFDVATAARDPLLQVFSSEAMVAENDDWEQGDDPLLVIDAAAVSGAFSLEPGSLDAAVVLTLDPGLYTVHVRPAKGTAGGEVLLETYYLD